MPRILIAEDNDLTRDTLTRFLSFEGYEVESAENGAQALLLLDGNRFDLIISDIVMPQLNGWDLSERVSSLYPDTPILLMTAYAPKESGAAEARGAADLMLKPIQLDEMLSKVRRLLHGKPATKD